MTGQANAGRPNQLLRNLKSKIASIPMILTAVVIFLGGTLWTVFYSFTNSKLLPRLTFVGLDQYERLWAAPRWLVSIQNLAIYGVFSLIFSLVIGFLLAALMDQKIRFENTFRTIFLYPFALSFIVTGLVWQWILNPEFGIQSVVRSLGWSSFTFDPLYDRQHRHLRRPDRSTLAGYRARHVPDAGRSARHRRGYLEGFARRWYPDVEDLCFHRHSDDARRVHHHAGDHRQRHRARSTILSWRRPAAALVSLRRSLPKYVYDYMFQAQNLGQGFAASTMMLLTVAIIIVPWAYLEFGGRKRG
jgi:glucose/mannose transport system permease protein